MSADLAFFVALVGRIRGVQASKTLSGASGPTILLVKCPLLGQHTTEKRGDHAEASYDH